MGPVLGIHGQPLFFPRLTPALEFAILGAVCGADVEGSMWRVWQVAPVFPICGRPLALFRVQLLCPIFIRSRGSIR
jgi:hypothetical protein